MDAARSTLLACNNHTTSYEHEQAHLQERCDMLEYLIDSVQMESLEFQTITNSKGEKIRVKKNVNLNIDLTEGLKVVFTGLRNLFHYSSLKELQANDEKIFSFMNGTSKVLHYIHQTQQHLAYAFEKMKLDYHDKWDALQVKFYELIVKMDQRVHNLEHATDMTFIVDNHIDMLKDLSGAASIFVQNKIPSTLVSITEAQIILRDSFDYAATKGKVPLISSPLDIYNLDTTVFEEDGDWYLGVHVPLVDREHAYELYRFINYPFLLESNSNLPALQIDEEENILIGIQNNSLIQDRKYFYAHESMCKPYSANNALLCTGVRVQRDISKTCLPSMVSKSVAKPFCKFKEFYGTWGPNIIGNKVMIFLDEATELNISYGNMTSQNFIHRGRYQHDRIPGLFIESYEWEWEIPSASNLGQFPITWVNMTVGMVSEWNLTNSSLDTDKFILITPSRDEPFEQNSNVTFVDETLDDMDNQLVSRNQPAPGYKEDEWELSHDEAIWGLIAVSGLCILIILILIFMFFCQKCKGV